MRRDQDRRQRKIQAPRQLAERVPLQSAGLAGGEADQAAVGEAGPAQRQRGSGWFEQIRPDPAPATAAPAGGGGPQPGTLVRAPRRPPWAWLLSVVAVTLAVGMVLGFAVGSGRSSGKPTSAPAMRAPTQPARPPQTSVVVAVRSVASSACLETARRADQVIGLLISKQRGRAADLLVAYTVASRQCRKDASP
jgi:hypothetical protein